MYIRTDGASEYIRAALCADIKYFFAGLVASSLVSVPAAFAENYALAIGISKYNHVASLTNPVNDASAVTSVLQQLGFEAKTVPNANRMDFFQVIEEVVKAVHNPDLFVFYYAGHGVQIGGRNFLVPRDSPSVTSGDWISGLVELEEIVLHLNRLGPNTVIVIILDACRTSPIIHANGDPVSVGLAIEQDLPGNIAVFYAAAAGQSAADGAGINSPFTAAFVTALSTRPTDIFSLFGDVRRRVLEATDGRQVPWFAASLDRPIVLGDVDRQAEADIESVKSLPALVDESFWATIDGSGHRKDFEGYITHFPDGRHRQSALDAMGSAADESIALDLTLLQNEAVSAGGGVTLCDALASDDLDPERVAPGINAQLMNAPLVLRECLAALASVPASPRHLHMTARALYAVDRREEAERFYREAALLGYGSSAVAYWRALVSRGAGDAELNEASRMLRSAALEGNSWAQNELSASILRGRLGESWAGKSLYWVQLAAEKGRPGAINLLGDVYSGSFAIEPDHTEARRYFQIAADLGNHAAMNNMGRIYELGRGVEIDLEDAVHWYSLATEAGDRFAPYWLGQLYETGRGVELAPSVPRSFMSLH